MRLDSDQSRTLQCSTLNNWQISHLSTPLCLVGPPQSARTHPCIRSLYIWAWPWSSPISAIISQWSQCTGWKSVDLAVHNFCSRFDSESRRNVIKKYKVLTLETKIKLLEDVDTKAMMLTEIFEKYGVHKRTVSKTVKNWQQVEEAYTSFSFQPDWKRMRTGKMEDVDEVLYRWFKQARVMSANNILMEKAKHKLEGRLINYSGVQGRSFKA